MASQTLVIKETGDVISEEEWFKDPMLVMSVSQEQVALLLEVAYLALKDHPDVAKEVRLSANMSRTQHMMTQGLMKQFVVTSSNILKTMIPLMRTAVKLKKSAILKPMFEKVLKFSVEMRDETVKTRDSYFELQRKIQLDTANVNTKNAEVSKQEEEISEQLKTEEERKKRAERYYNQKEKEKNKIEKEVDESKKKRDEILQQAVPDKENNETFKNFMSGFMNPNAMNPDPLGVKTVAKGVVGILGMVVNTVRQSVEGDRAIKASEEVHKHMLDATKEKKNVEEAANKAEAEMAEADHELRMLELKKASLGDIESLLEASEYLAKIDGQLMCIVTFWDNLAAFLKNLTMKGDMAECFLEAIEDDECATMFNEELSKIEGGWQHFGGICGRYVQHTERSIPRIYGFLSEPIDKLNHSERKERTQKLLAQIAAQLPQKMIEGKKNSN